jgi:hypothetical protein
MKPLRGITWFETFTMIRETAPRYNPVNNFHILGKSVTNYSAYIPEMDGCVATGDNMPECQAIFYPSFIIAD